MVDGIKAQARDRYNELRDKLAELGVEVTDPEFRAAGDDNPKPKRRSK